MRIKVPIVLLLLVSSIHGIAQTYNPMLSDSLIIEIITQRLDSLNKEKETSKYHLQSTILSWNRSSVSYRINEKEAMFQSEKRIWQKILPQDSISLKQQLSLITATEWMFPVQKVKRRKKDKHYDVSYAIPLISADKQSIFIIEYIKEPLQTWTTDIVLKKNQEGSWKIDEYLGREHTGY